MYWAATFVALESVEMTEHQVRNIPYISNVLFHVFIWRYISLTLHHHFSCCLGNNANAQDGTDDGSGVIQQVSTIVDETLCSDIYFKLSH